MAITNIQLKLKFKSCEVTGDNLSIHVIFNNLTGRNYVNINDWDSYIVQVEDVYQFKLEGNMTMLDQSGQIIKQGKVGQYFESVVTA